MMIQNPQNPTPAPSPEEIDDLIACALLGKLSPEEQARLNELRQADPAIESLYQETRMTHQLLQNDSRAVMPDPDFEQRILSGVKQKLEPPKKVKPRMGRMAFLYRWIFSRNAAPYAIGGAVALFVLVVATQRDSFGYRGAMSLDPTSAVSLHDSFQVRDDAEKDAGKKETLGDRRASLDADSANEKQLFGMQNQVGAEDERRRTQTRLKDISPPLLTAHYGSGSADESDFKTPQGTSRQLKSSEADAPANSLAQADSSAAAAPMNAPGGAPSIAEEAPMSAVAPPPPPAAPEPAPTQPAPTDANSAPASTPDQSRAKTESAGAQNTNNGAQKEQAEDISRKLIRNATLQLEVINYTETGDKINSMAKANGGYVDSTTSERGGNGKLQGTIVVKVKPEKLDDFLLQLRALGTVQNQSISTEDVTKEYYDTAARLTNSQKTEEQLQDLLTRNNGKVSELLQVEKEMNRVRGDIESMEGQLKLYDFQVQFATVTITLEEKNLDQSARFLLKENDTLTLNTDEVESTFQNAKTAVDTVKGQIVSAQINRTSPTQITAQLEVSIPPDHIDAFLAALRGLGRVEGLQRQTERVAQDGGDSDRPATDTTTEKDSVNVSITIALDYGGQDQVSMTVVTHNVEDIFQKAKQMAVDDKGTILASNLDKDQNGNSVASLQVRIPGASYTPLLDFLRSSGRIPFFSRTDHNNDANAAQPPMGGLGPVLLQVSITDDEPAIQNSEVSIVTDAVEDKVGAVKNSLAGFDASLKSSTYRQDPDGRAEAALVIKLPMKDYPKMSDSLKALGRVESFSIAREERPHPIPLSTADKNAIGTQEDEMAPAEIHLTIHSQPDIVPADNGIWATLRNAFSSSLSVLGSSFIMVIVLVAGLLPWLILASVIGLIVKLVFFRAKK